MTDAVPSAVLMCHAPIVIPDIAGPEAERIETTTGAMREVAEHVVAQQPDAVVIASPHAPREGLRWLVAADARVSGTFARFGRPNIGAAAAAAPQASGRIEQAASALGVPCGRAELGDLDHGTLVPLWFLAEAGWQGPTVRLALPMAPSHSSADTMGRAIARAASESGQRWVVVASGDMSHRLQPGAPAGYDPEAHHFDEGVVERVKNGHYGALPELDGSLRERAGEDVIDTLDVAAGAVGGDATGHRVVSYEGPFGVGYLVAVLHAPAAA